MKIIANNNNNDNNDNNDDNNNSNNNNNTYHCVSFLSLKFKALPFLDCL